MEDPDRFNPTLVRLRLTLGKTPRERPATFQSHAGSIEATQISAPSVANSRGFNPTLVRLRQERRAAEERLKQRFNPTLVRLRLFLGRGGSD